MCGLALTLEVNLGGVFWKAGSVGGELVEGVDWHSLWK